MVTQVISLLFIVFAQTPVPQGTAAAVTNGYLPRGSPSELSDLGLLARLRDPGVQAIGFSSYDRTGGNNDGFSGKYSRIRAENGNSVLAEAEGPGIVQRIWFTHTAGEQPGLLDRKHEHIKIYLDQQKTPVLDVPLESVFSGMHPHFPRPLVWEGSGGFVSYVPIPFQRGCKVLVEGLGVRFYQIDLVRLPPDASVVSFTAKPGGEEKASLARAAAFWSQPGNYESTELADAEAARYEVDGVGNSSHQYVLRPGPATIRSIALIPATGTEEAWKSARLRMVWDQDDPANASVDLPMGLAFGQVDGASPYQSLLVGQREGTWYNRFPMPYHRQAIIQVDTDRPIKGTIQVVTVRGIAPDAGIFHCVQRQSLPTRNGEDFHWLRDEGRGHFAGVLLVTEGKAKLPYWLEGDDRFVVDGRLAIHGTGTEDYFNCGWYALEGRLDRPAAYAVHGFPVYRQRGETWQVAAYRWHLSDPVPFARCVEAGIEHGGENNVAADYRAAVSWYSDRPGPSRTAN